MGGSRSQARVRRGAGRLACARGDELGGAPRGRGRPDRSAASAAAEAGGGGGGARGLAVRGGGRGERSRRGGIRREEESRERERGWVEAEGGDQGNEAFTLFPFFLFVFLIIITVVFVF